MGMPKLPDDAYHLLTEYLRSAITEAGPEDWRTNQAWTTFNSPGNSHVESGSGQLIDFIFFRSSSSSRFRVTVEEYSMPFYRWSEGGKTKSVSDHEAIKATLRVEAADEEEQQA